jgi:hypothetical protein
MSRKNSFLPNMGPTEMGRWRKKKEKQYKMKLIIVKFWGRGKKEASAEKQRRRKISSGRKQRDQVCAF